MWLGAAARLSYGMGAVGLLVFGKSEGLSTAATAGMASLFTLGLALATPLWGGIADRRGIRGVILICLAGNVVGTLAVVVGRGISLSLGGALLIGSSTPPLAATMRATWNRLLPEGPPRERAAAVESALAEGVHIGGRLLVALLVEVRPSLIMPTACAVFVVAGSVLGLDGRLRSASPSSVAISYRTLLRGSRDVLLLTVVITTAHGAVATSMVLGRGLHGSFAGPLTLACWGAGSAIGGLVLATRRSVAAPVLIAGGLGAFGLVTAVSVAFFGRQLGLSVLLALLLGLPLSPMFAGLYRTAASRSAGGRETQTLALVSSMVVIGFSIGSSVTGLLGSVLDPSSAGFLVASVATFAALLLAVSIAGSDASPQGRPA